VRYISPITESLHKAQKGFGVQKVRFREVKRKLMFPFHFLG